MANAQSTYTTLSESSLYSTSQLTRIEEKTTISATNERLSNVIEKTGKLKSNVQLLPTDLSIEIDESWFKFTYAEELEKKQKIDDLFSEITQWQQDIAKQETRYNKIQVELEIQEKLHKEKKEAYNRLEVIKIIEKIKHLIKIQVVTEYDRKLVEDLKTLRAEFQWLIQNREFVLINVDFDIIEIIVKITSEFKSEMFKLEQEITDLSVEIENLKNQIKNHKKEVEQLETREEIVTLVEYKKIDINWEIELAEKIEKYVTLMDYKLLIDSELSIYQKLVGSNKSKAVIDKHTGRKLKISADSKIETAFDEINILENYIQLTNKGAIKNDLTNWKIKSIANDNAFEMSFESMANDKASTRREYKFESELVLKPGESVKIFSHNAGDTHHPLNIKHRDMKDKWSFENNIHVQLFDDKGNEKAYLHYFYQEH